MNRLIVGGAVGTALAAVATAVIVAVTGVSPTSAFFIGCALGAVGGTYGVVIASR